MTLTFELIIFIASILFGALLYWRESQGNGMYRFFNKMMNSKELQMKPEDKKGFFYQQNFLFRLVYVTVLFLVGVAVARFLIPIDVTTLSLFASMIVGTLGGTYLAGFIFKSGKMIDENSGTLEEIVSDTIDKGKDFIEDLKPKKTEEVEAPKKVEQKPEAPKKSARERLKDKGYL